MKIVTLLLVHLLLYGCAADVINLKRNTSYIPSFVLSEKSLFKIKDDQKHSFGYLEVPEKRSALSNKIIRLPVYIFKSRNPNPEKDPIIYTVGGPGSSTMPSAQYMEYYKYLDDRDLILFEQRGTTYAQPHLDCPEWAGAIYRSRQPSFKTEDLDKLFTQALTDCRKRLVDKGIDLNGYNTNEIAADIEDLRKVLGLEKYNLLTISYSTKIAQVLLRDYPGAIRSVVMDSPLPLEVNYDEQSVSNLLEVTRKLLSDCGKNSDCNKAYPQIEMKFFDYLRQITETPLEVIVKNPKTNKSEQFFLKGKDIISIIASGGTSQVSSVPGKINQLLNNDLSWVQKQLSYRFRAAGSGAGMGMRLSVWCSEEYPFTSQKRIAIEKVKYPSVKGFSPAVFLSSTCEQWNVIESSPIENLPIVSKVPVLFISGEYDSATPVKWAKAMRKNLTNSFHFIFKGWKHTPTTNWDDQCAMKVANAFFNNPYDRPIDNCFEQIKRKQFIIEKVRD